jgi:hypothetical protein
VRPSDFFTLLLVGDWMVLQGQHQTTGYACAEDRRRTVAHEMEKEKEVSMFEDVGQVSTMAVPRW